ncbi:MAG: 3-hydroxybutyryl-CoA dehydrogenase [Chloroflexia bacterium]|nr:3-hydroxybutyryl-CoA dehydrogenase [Chloroflexia bacterium]
MEIRKVAVIGAGTMGRGIAQVFAQSGYETIMIDVVEEQLQDALASIKKFLGRSVEKGRLSQEELDGLLERLQPAGDLGAAADADFVVEAASENVEIKKKIFGQLDELCRPEVILSSNTSSIPITLLAAATQRPDQVIGMHFMNPVPLMVLVEIIRGLPTSDETMTITVDLAEKLGKTPVEVNDFPGFISNRILMPMINEAVFALMEGVATKEAIDQIMILGMNHPMGPLALADLIGLDVCLAILEVMHGGLGDPKYRPCPLLRKYVDAGWLGRKSGRGFYNYAQGEKPPQKPR